AVLGRRHLDVLDFPLARRKLTRTAAVHRHGMEVGETGRLADEPCAATIRQEAGAAEPERAWSGEPCLIGVVAEQCECARRRVDRPEPRVLEVVVERGDEAVGALPVPAEKAR